MPRRAIGAQRLRVYRLLTLSLSLIMGVAICEVGIRLRQWWRYGAATRLYETTIDPISGLTVAQPNQRTSRLTTNSLGFRSPEIVTPKPPDTIRLAFLGASTTFCAEVSSDAATWPSLVTAAFQRQWPSVRFDFVNAALPGYVIDSNRRSLRYRVRQTEPDVIVYYEAVNDLSKDLRELAVEQNVWRGEVDGEHVLSRWSVAWMLLEKNIRLAFRRHEASRQSGRHVTFEPSSLSAGFRTQLTAFVDEARAVAPIVVLATFSQKVREGQTPTERLSNANTHLYYMPFLAIDDILPAFAEYNRVIRETAAATHAVFIDREDNVPADDMHFADSVHFTDEGSRAMASRVATALLASDELRSLVARRSATAPASAGLSGR